MFSKLFRYNQTKFRSTKLGNNQNIVLELSPLLRIQVFLYIYIINKDLSFQKHQLNTKMSKFICHQNALTTGLYIDRMGQGGVNSSILRF